MSFGGHVLDMINRIKQNEALKQSRRKRINKIKDVYFNEVIEYCDKNNLKEISISEEKMIEIKKKIRTQLKKDRIRSMLLTSSAVVIICSFIFYLLSNRIQF